MKTKRFYLVLPLLLLSLCLLFTGCSSKNYSDSNANGGTYLPEASGDADYGYGDTELPDKGDVESGEETLVQKIIRTVYMEAQTKEFDRAISELRAALAAQGGYEESFRTTGRVYGEDYTVRRASMTLRIPAEKLDAFLGEIGDLVHVINQNATLSNVTNEYYDIEARLAVLESQRIAYDAMLAKATNTNEILTISKQLYDVIEEIEAYKARLRVLDSQVSYSTVTMTLEEVIEYSKINTGEESFGERVLEAFTSSWQSFADNAQSFLVWLVGALPTLLVLGVIGGVVLVIVLRMNRKHARAKAPRKDAGESSTENKE